MTKFEKQIKKLLSEQRQLLALKSKEGGLYGVIQNMFRCGNR